MNSREVAVKTTCEFNAFDGLRVFLMGHSFQTDLTIFMTPYLSGVGDAMVKADYLVPLCVSEIMKVRPTCEDKFVVIDSVNLGDDECYWFKIDELIDQLRKTVNYLTVNAEE